MGNNRVVADQNGTIIQRNHYYPFGMSFADNTGGEKQPYKYNGKEEDTRHGLNLYDYLARQYDGTVPRFTSIDPHAENYYSWSPYVYVMNNPIRLIDRDGRDPGDPFKTPEAAAKDFAKIYNGISIVVGVELGSSIYIIETKGGKKYTYSPAAVGDKDGTKISLPPNGETPIADIHSHGAWDEGYINNDFSPTDKKSNIKKGIDGYVTTPDGSLKKYDVEK